MIRRTVLLASQPFLLLGMRSPDRPWWSSGRPWTRTLTVVVVTLVAITVGAVEYEPVAELLQQAAFPPVAWPLVVAVALVTTSWSETLKPGSSRDGG